MPDQPFVNITNRSGGLPLDSSARLTMYDPLVRRNCAGVPLTRPGPGPDRRVVGYEDSKTAGDP